MNLGGVFRMGGFSGGGNRFSTVQRYRHNTICAPSTQSHKAMNLLAQSHSATTLKSVCADSWPV